MLRTSFWGIGVALFVTGCSCSDPAPVCETDAECDQGQTCREGMCQGEVVPEAGTNVPDGGPKAPMDGGGNGSMSDCDPACGDGETCVDGACCSVDRVCAGACCGGSEECFASACVVPGSTCRSTRDCEDGEFCELGLDP
ncbi:MAG: hypothetical protein KC416_14590, partial [Myxococcales bacterium]|nr:hypothetical protein [Myxococcales bacterium]